VIKSLLVITSIFAIGLVLLSINVSAEERIIPSWIKNNAGWWADEQIDDSTFIQGIQFLIREGIMTIPLTQSSDSADNEIPKNNAGWWADEQIDDSTFIQGIQFLIKKGFLRIHSYDMIDDTLPTFLFKVYFDGENTKPDGTYMRYIFELKPEGSELYDEYKVGIKKHAVVFPTFTHSAYSSPGFYDYYRGDCDKTCLTTNIRKDFNGVMQTGDSSWQILRHLGYAGITDIDIDKNPKILNDYDKIILLHNEYVTQKEFDAITSHPNVIYLYPNSLYAKVDVNYNKNTISLIKGHNYPSSEIRNGFDWEYDNTHPYEFDVDCLDWQFYPIDNGLMLNCYPEDRI